MKFHKLLIMILMLAALAVSSVSCIEDGVSSSPSDQPAFSVDTLDLGVVYTSEPAPTRRFTVYNRHSKIITLSNIEMRGEGSDRWRLNVDGHAGNSLTNIDIRPNDSILVFVETTLADVGRPGVERRVAHIDFTTNGVTQSVPVAVSATDLARLGGCVIERDTVFSAAYPIHVADSLVVAEGATLTLQPGVRLLFHDKAYFTVRGTLISEGTPDSPVDMTGDRTGNVAANIPYDIMASQWDGVYFAPASRGNDLRFTTIRNTVTGVQVDSLAQLSLRSCRLRNAAYYPLAAGQADITAVGCEFAEGGEGIVYLRGGSHRFDHCTLANYFLFSAIGGPALQLNGFSDETNASDAPLMKALFTNCIFYGLGFDLTDSDFTDTGVNFERCLFKSEASECKNFVNCLWDTDPLYHTERMEYYFDYRLQPESPAADAAQESEFTPVLSPDGDPVDTHLGAYPPAPLSAKN
ncbi:MAG: hypothetical protein K2M05_01165 [Paramuribaculum sp.]|nr:hypothetical protein [Paramuribaculum sp.]